MKTGFIGAGKVGVSLGRYFAGHGLEVTGYYDTSTDAAAWAAEFTNTKHYRDLLPIVKESDVLFLTVPDGAIGFVWEQIKPMPIKGRIICHCSGAMSARDVFSDISKTGAYGCSVHPLFAVSDKYHSYEELHRAYFTMEGDKECLGQMMELFAGLGNNVQTIDSSMKTVYHAAAAICSNQVTALASQSIDMLIKCGFSPDTARKVLRPIMCGNLEHVAGDGVVESLTGPVERGDTGTVKKHLSVLEGEEDKLLYALLSKKLAKIARKKNPLRDYTALEEVLDQTVGQSCKMLSRQKG